MTAAIALAEQVGPTEACSALGVSRATLHRRVRPMVDRPAVAKRSHRALTAGEQEQVLEILNSERFVDASPAEVRATLLDEGTYVSSVSTMYRLLRARRSVRERRSVRRHPSYPRPELVATGPNQVWTWDITKVRGPDRRTWFHLYVALDLFSRYVVGWHFSSAESGSQARQFLEDAVEREGVPPDQLTLHADRGTSMRSRTVAEMLDDLGVKRSHSRPKTSNDNAFSEAQFKTVKHSPYFPGSFATVPIGRTYFDLFFSWYNEEHHHEGLEMFTPQTVYRGRVEEALRARQSVLDVAYALHPERFGLGAPVAKRPPSEVRINAPTAQQVVLAEPPAETA